MIGSLIGVADLIGIGCRAIGVVCLLAIDWLVGWLVSLLVGSLVD